MNSNNHSKRNNSNKYHTDSYYESVVLNYSTDCAFVYSLERKVFLYVSPAIYKLIGYTVEELLEKSFSSIFTPKSNQHVTTEIDRRIYRFREGEKLPEIIYSTSDFEICCKDGSIKILEFSSTLFMDEGQNEILLSGIARDVTARYQYETDLIHRLKKAHLIITKKEHPKDAPFDVHIYFFHKFRVLKKDSSQLHWHTLKNEELFAFFLSYKGKTILKDDIIDNLWPNLNLQKSSAYLHNTLYSMKKDLQKANIVFSTKFKNNSYTYEIQNYTSDIDIFETLSNKIVLPFHHIDEESVECFESLIRIYQGDYLDLNGYLWAIPKSLDYFEKFKSASLTLAKYYFINRNYKDTKRILNKILSIDYFDESVHELLLKVYLKSKNFTSFIEHFNSMYEKLYPECHTKPKKSVQKLYDTYYLFAKRFTENSAASFP